MPRRRRTEGSTPESHRLVLTRLALGYEDQGEFAKAVGLAPNTYNPWETGTTDRTISRQGASKICKKFPDVKPEWLLEGDPGRLPHHFVLKLTMLGAFPVPENIIRKTRR